jgi:hypothetical protein
MKTARRTHEKFDFEIRTNQRFSHALNFLTMFGVAEVAVAKAAPSRRITDDGKLYEKECLLKNSFFLTYGILHMIGAKPTWFNLAHGV